MKSDIAMILEIIKILAIFFGPIAGGALIAGAIKNNNNRYE